jgi:hypothetical protein
MRAFKTEMSTDRASASKVEEFVMRSRFRVLFVVTTFVLASFVFFLASASSSIGAQAVPTATSAGSVSPIVTASGTEAVIPVFSTNNNGAFLTLIESMDISSGLALADLHANSGSDIWFDTQDTLGVACANVVVYRVVETQDLVFHPSTCEGDTLSLKGTGGNFKVDYIVDSFDTAAGAKAAPPFIARNLAGTPAATVSGTTTP